MKTSGTVPPPTIASTRSTARPAPCAPPSVRKPAASSIMSPEKPKAVTAMTTAMASHEEMATWKNAMPKNTSSHSVAMQVRKQASALPMRMPLGLIGETRSRTSVPRWRSSAMPEPKASTAPNSAHATPCVKEMAKLLAGMPGRMASSVTSTETGFQPDMPDAPAVPASFEDCAAIERARPSATRMASLSDAENSESLSDASMRSIARPNCAGSAMDEKTVRKPTSCTFPTSMEPSARRDGSTTRPRCGPAPVSIPSTPAA